MPWEDEDSDSSIETISEEKTQTDHPKMWKVILLNDDYTSMDFVVSVLETIFKKAPAEAAQLMLQVHRKGSAVCGIYAKQIAEAKIVLVHSRAKANGYPLKCVLEEA